jgi:predicted unusual protein kinase regulating ubiquinone biosynthesis (AarF/ABC1/UbiB family)
VAELKQNQADGILEILEAIIDSDVDRSVRAFQQMGVLKDGADLDVVRAKVADNYRTGKIKAKNRKKNGQKCPISQHDIMAPSNDNEGSKSNHSSNDAQVMKYFTLPAEYAFVGRALTQMDGVGKSLDPDFDFVSAAAPWFYEIKGADMYLMDEAAKKLDDLKIKLFGAWNSAPTTPDYY